MHIELPAVSHVLPFRPAKQGDEWGVDAADLVLSNRDTRNPRLAQISAPFGYACVAPPA